MAELITVGPRAPRTAIWEITSACNLRCIHCEAEAGTRRADELTTEEALSLCDALAAAGCKTCNVSGGEPLLRADWPLLCERLTERGVQVTLISNGSLLTEEAIATARRVGVRACSVSLDGLQPTHDRIRVRPRPGPSQFAEALAGLDRVVAAGLPAAAITHVNRWNLGELEAIHALLGEHGVALWQVQLGSPLGRQREIQEPYMIAPEQLPGLAERLVALIRAGRPPRLGIVDCIGYYTEAEPVLRSSRSGEPALWTGCYAGLLQVGIESNGDIKGCSSMPREFVAGNVRQRPFQEIWDDESRFAYNTDWREEKLTGFCATCAYRRVCRAGCTSLAYSVTGSIYENPFCLHRVRCERGGR